MQAEQTRLLYRNAPTGTAVTAVAAPLLAYFQWGAIAHAAVLAWLAYTFAVLVGRAVLARRYWQSGRDGDDESGRWITAFAAGAGVAGAGWGAAGVALYPHASPMNQVFLIFVLGGMMLGGASVLAARPEAFLAFLLPTGLLPAIRLLAEGDQEHLAMGLLAVIFTVAVVATTWRFYQTIASSLELTFVNQDLLADLQAAIEHTDDLNRQLERRVEERTAELHQANERLRAEIRHREQMEEELLRQRKLESLGVLAGGIAHDFNNFLTIVQGSIDLARMRLDPGDPTRRVFDRTEAACQRAMLLSSQLLTFAKGGAPVRRIVSVRALVLDAAQLARAGAAVRVDVEAGDDLWPVEADAGQMGQVLHNIFLNAKQAMPEGGVIDVRAQNVSAGAEGAGGAARVRVAIRDHGGGIAPENLSKVFDPYFTTKRAGSGLGLATAYAIVTKHGGRLLVESKPGDGAVFVIDLPASQSPAAAPAPRPAAARLQKGTGRVLVMDDEEALRALLSQVLKRLGYDVATARDGAEAIALFEAAAAAGRAFDAVLLDLTVPGGMGGADAAARLRQIDPLTKLVASSGYADAPVMSSFRDYGFDDVLPKPWGAAQLSDVVRRVLADEGDDAARAESPGLRNL